MRLDELYNELLTDQLEYYDRMYTISSGVENGWSRTLKDTRREFIKNRFNILKKPFVEGIPRYHKDASWTWSNLSDGFTGTDKQELDELAELLGSYAEWTPYPHQIESVQQWQQGKHVVVATGTGSGKTECFLYPMLGQLLRESQRAKQRDEVMQRGVKALVLYPMNALVADQTVRIRDLFGTHKMAQMLQEKGAGRYCQFGMYTGRTPSHGWYSEPGSKPGKWKIKGNGPRGKVMNIVKAYQNIEQEHPELWQRLVDDRRVPAKGSTENWSLQEFSQGISDQSFKCRGKDINFIGTKGDRELFARYEMHQGGLIQYAFNSSEPSDEQREGYAELTNHLGVPDILVTNYSMLEYMLLRPLEHVFWEDTKTWLHGKLQDGEKPRKLMLVLDEAHLYQGAMGTEVSMLIDRLRSVLSKDGKNPPIQVIITSASLGNDDSLKKQFVADLTGIDPDDVVVPKPQKTNLLSGRNWDDLEERFSCIEELMKCDAKTEFMEEGEYNFLKKICDDSSLQNRLKNHYESSGDLYERMELRHNILQESDIFVALYTALQHPGLISENLHHLRPNGDKPSPWQLDNLSELVIGTNNESALSRLLDLIAGSRVGKTASKTGSPLMPIRGHIFSRGLPRLSVCPRCSTFHTLETLRCDEVLSDGNICNSRPFELVYGRSTGVAFLNLWLERLDSGDSRDGLSVSNDTQMAYPSPIDGSKNTRRVGLAAWRCKKSDEYTHILDMKSGELIPRNKFNHSIYRDDQHCCLAVAGFSNGSFDYKLLWSNRRTKGKDKEYFANKCPETKRKHGSRWARQVSNLETRGNEAFSGLIDGLLQLQDVVNESSHLPNKGKKCLIFSDSRQQAANVAVELGELSNHDETRRLLIEFLNCKWYNELDSIHHSIAGMYPWFALFCGSKGINPFAGGQYSDDRTLIEAAGLNCLSSILAAYALKFSGQGEIEFSPNKSMVENIMNQYKPSHKQPFSFDGLEFDERVSMAIRGLNNQIPYDSQGLNRAQMKIKSFVKSLIPVAKSAENFEQLTELEKQIEEEIENPRNSNWNEYLEMLVEVKNIYLKALNDPIPFAIFWGSFQRINSTLARKWLVSNINLVTLYSKCIELISHSDVQNFFENWNYFQGADEALPIHQKESGRWTNNWATFIIKIMFDGEYGVEEIGIGYNQISEHYWNKIDQKLRSMFPEARYLLPRIASHSFNRIKNGSPMRSAVFSDKRMPAFSPENIGKDNPFNDDTPGTIDLSKLKQLISETYLRDKPDINQMFLQRLLTTFVDNNILIGAYSKFGINAEAIQIKPVISGSVRICKTCYRPRLTPIEEDKTKCGSCQSVDFIDSSNSEFSRRFKSLRIDSWRKSIQKLLDGEEAFLLRAEEHTAQIGDKLDDSDLYSPAELHELQFQDLPVPDSTSVVNERSTLPPIDVLSCTTTMEVGIDIGSLTCVALRSMPPHSANYQQRIGRAGRGSSEVSVALTWADNSAYAQQLFEEPQRLLHHPDSPPLLYMENQRIRQRHFHAALLQQFMKHQPYIRELLIFEGMASKNKAITPNMVESLGMVDTFFGDIDHPYGYEAFREWLDNFVDEDFIIVHFAKNDPSLVKQYVQWKDQFINRLNNYRKEVLG